MSWQRRSAAAFLLGLVAVVPLARAQGGDRGGDLARHGVEVQALTRVAEDVLGPLPAVAFSPFFSLAGLTALALFARSGHAHGFAFLERLGENKLIREAGEYASLSLCFALLGLGILVYLANSGKIQGMVGKLLRMLEDGSVALLYTLLLLSAVTGLAGSSEQAMVVELGLASATAGGILALGGALGLVALMVTRFAFDVLIWLSPVPFIDLVFESAKKGMAAALVALYVWSPLAALALSLVLIMASMLTCSWAFRLLGFAFGVVLDPLLARLLPGRRTGLLDASLAAPLHVKAEIVVATRAAALAVPGIKTRTAGALVYVDGRLGFMARTLFARPKPVWLTEERGGKVVLLRTLLWLEVRVLDHAGVVRHRVALSSRLLSEEARLRAILGAEAGGPAGRERLAGGAPHAEAGT